MNREQLILYILANSEKPLSSSDIGKMVGRSIRTIKYDMEKVDSLAREIGGLLKSKRGTGYWVEVIDNENFSQALFQLNIRETFFKNYSGEINTDYFRIMQYLIAQKDYFKIEEVCNKFYISRNIAQEVISLFREFLTALNLRLVSKPNYGLKVIGDEFSIRLAMITLFQIHFHKIEYTPTIKSFYIYFEKDLQEIIDVRNILLNTLRQNDYSVTDILTQALSRYLILQKNRNNSNLKITFDPTTSDTIKQFSSAYVISKKVFKHLENYYNQSFDQNEIQAFTLLLIVSRDISSDVDVKMEYKPLWKYIDQIVTDFLYIYLNKVEIDRINKEVLYNYLIASLTPPITQLYFNFNFIESFSPEYVYTGKLELHAYYMSKLSIELISNTFESHISINLFKRLNNNFSILLKKLEVFQERRPINILIASSHGTKSAKNIGQLLQRFLNSKILGKIQYIELYEGRKFSENEFDLFVLEDIDPVFYNYSWDLIVFNNENFETDFQNLINKIITYQNR